MIDAAAVRQLADSYSFQRDECHRTCQEVALLEEQVQSLRARCTRTAADEQACYDAFVAAFAPLRVNEHEGHDWHYPHCDQWVLHAPGKCEFCDMCPEAQARRIEVGVCFTGQPEEGKCPCPSELLRGIEIVNRWPGNRAAPRE